MPKTIVLVHGAFSDGSSWDRVVPLLTRQGYRAVVVHQPFTSLADDVAATERVIEASPGEVILVGHSYGGAVITAAGQGPKVRALVYVAAFAPDAGESINDLSKGQEPPPWTAALKADSAGFLSLPPEALAREFAPDLSVAEAKLLAAKQGPIAGRSFADKLPAAAWHGKPSWYLLTLEDRMIDPRAQTFMAQRMGATIANARASHVVMLSMPARVASVILSAARLSPSVYRQESMPKEMVAALDGVFGKNPGARAVHAKGFAFEGHFAPSAAASSVSVAPHLQDARVPIVVRFSNFAGIPDIPDTHGMARPLGMSVKFLLPDGSETDIVAHSFNGFPAPTADEFRKFLQALAATAGPNASDPKALDAYLDAHPVAKEFLQGQIPLPESYGTVAYFGVNTFQFTNATGRVTYGRYQLRPVGGERAMEPERARNVSRDVLAGELRNRLASGAVEFKLLLEMAGSEDDLDNPSIAWPASRAKVELGTLTIERPVADNEAAERDLAFVPRPLPGIDLRDPMLKARSAAYPVSRERRRLDQGHGPKQASIEH